MVWYNDSSEPACPIIKGKCIRERCLAFQPPRNDEECPILYAYCNALGCILKISVEGK